MYALLKPHVEGLLAESNHENIASVHFLPYPTVQESLFNTDIERKINAMQQVIQLARTTRERANVTLKTPLLTMVIIGDQQKLSDVEALQSYIEEELNVRDVVLSNDEERYDIRLVARPDWPKLGTRLKKDVQIVRKALPSLTQAQLRQFQRQRKMNIEGIELEASELLVTRTLAHDKTPHSTSVPGGNTTRPLWEAAFSDEFVVLLDVKADSELIEDGIARDVANRLQKMRKKVGLIPTDDILMQYEITQCPETLDFDQIVTNRQMLFESALRGKLEPVDTAEHGGIQSVLLEEEHALGGVTIMLRLVSI